MMETTRPPVVIPDPAEQPTVGVELAANAWDVWSPTVIYRMAADGAFPFACQKVAGRWRVSTADLRRSLGMPT